VWEPLTEDELAWAERTQATPPCPVGRVSSSLAKTALKNKRVLFAGDSIMRNTYHAFNGLLDPSYRWNSSVSFRHGNLVQHVKTSNTSVAFYWAPFVRNITAVLDTLGGSTSEGAHGFDLLVSGAAAWDALYIRSPIEYSKDLSTLSARLRQARPSSPGVTVWMQPTTIVDNRLSSLEKQQHMSEKTIAVYRGLFEASPVRSGFSVTIDPTGASRGREGATVDGVHYSEDIYTLHFPRLYVKSPARKVGKAKATGPMSFPSYGIIVLVAAALMLYTMDPFLGVAWLVQRVVGVTEQQASDMTWEVAYREIHRKNHISHPTSSSSSGGGSRGGSERGGDSDRETEALKDSQQLEMAPASGGGEGSRA
jgi:GDSL/SGNH-like Acyl-Esterase family found in Pmr5 and Cas1p